MSQEDLATGITATEQVVAIIKVGPEHDPAVLDLAEKARKLREYAIARIIVKDTGLFPAIEDLSIIAKVKKALAEKKTDYLKPIKAHIDAVTAAFTSITQPLDEADSITRKKVMDYRAEVEKRRLEAEEINRQKQELAHREAAFNGTGEVTVDTTPVEAPAPIGRVFTDLGTGSTMGVYKWELVDIALVPREYLVVNAGMVTGVVKGSKGKIVIPGLRIWKEETLRVTTK